MAWRALRLAALTQSCDSETCVYSDAAFPQAAETHPLDSVSLHVSHAERFA